MGPGWWVASDGRWYPPQDTELPPPIGAPVAGLAPPASPQQPAGWYADPYGVLGNLRWWDGTGWTTHQSSSDPTPVASGPPAFTVRAQPALGSAVARQQPVALIVAAICLFLMFFCSFMPWGRVAVITFNGTDGDGIITAVLSLAAAGALLAAWRGTANRSALAWLSAGLTFAGGALYLFDAARLAKGASDLTESGDNVFGISVTLGFGLFLGVAAGVVGAFYVAIVAWRMRRHGSFHPYVGEPSGRDQAAVALGVYALSAAGVASWWYLAIALGVAAVGFAGFNGYNARTAPIKRAALVGSALGFLAVIGGGASRIWGTSDGPPQCWEMFADGETTRESWDGFANCLNEDGEPDTVYTSKPLCFGVKDDLPLSNDYGWGYPGEAWNAGEEYECE